MHIWPEFLMIVLAHALGVAVPGPDFAMVLRQSLLHGRRTAIWTSCGIGCGVSLHITYALLGIGLLFRSSEFAFQMLKYAGALYLGWIGWQALRSKPRPPEPLPADLAPGPAVSLSSAFATGFLTNALNPKATLFFLTLFPVVVSPTTPKLVQAGYGVWIIAYTTAWFILVSLVFTRREVRTRFLRYGHWLDRALGVLFLGFAVSLALTSFTD